MKQNVLKMVRCNAVCENGHRFAFHRFPDMSYGFKEARTLDPSDFAYVDCPNDPVCDELSQVLDVLWRGTSMKPRAMTRCFDLVLPFACDPAPSGMHYSFSGVHWCPVCKSTRVDIYDDFSAGLEEVSVPHVTHEHWQQLNATEKRDLVQSTLNQAGCL